MYLPAFVKELSSDRVQKVALRIILNVDYEHYDQALTDTGLQNLHERRVELCTKFATQCVKNEKTCGMFPLNPSPLDTRNYEKYYVQPATRGRLADSAIPYMQSLLNQL